MNHLRTVVVCIILSVLFAGCKDAGPRPLDEIVFDEVKTTLNPSGRVPLGALLRFSTKEPCRVALTIDGPEPLTRTFSTFNRLHEVPVIGLFANRDNKISLELTDEAGNTYTGETRIKTAPLPAVMPAIKVTTLNREAMEPGFHLFELQAANSGKFLTYTVIFDDRGEVRWFLDMSENGQITYTPYRLKNGNWLYMNWQDLLETDDLGRTVSETVMPGTAGNHEVLEQADGKLLMGGSWGGSTVIRDGQTVNTRFDHVLLFDPSEKRLSKHWDMRQVLDISRTYFPADYSLDPQADWFHVNSIAVDPKDQGLLVSGRNQGISKLGQDNSLKWIFAPHSGWEKAGFDGTGPATGDFLLTAVNSEGEAYPADVQSGKTSAPDFDWPLGQHSLSVLENGNLLVFDNGLYRNQQPQTEYSRAVEYAIDEENRTVRQVWQYGKERGLEMTSLITSDVDPLPQTKNRLITAGNVRLSEKASHARMVEITHPEKEVVFEAEIYFKDALGTKERSWGQFDIVFRGERYELFTPEKNK